MQQFLPIIREALKILEEPYIVTKEVQKPDCTLSDFYGALLIMEKRLHLWSEKSNKKTDLAQRLLEQFESRKNHLLNNEAMISTIFLDRRYACTLDDDRIAFAKLSLSRLWERARRIKLNGTHMPGTVAQSGHDQSNESDIQFNDSDIENFFANTSQATATTSSDSTTERTTATTRTIDFSITKDEFMLLLNDYETKYPRIHHKENILKFCKGIENDFPEIYFISTILNGIPAAQATVERVFSVLSFVYDEKRSKLNEDVLQNILLIKLNKGHLERVFQEDMEKLKKEHGQ